MKQFNSQIANLPSQNHGLNLSKIVIMRKLKHITTNSKTPKKSRWTLEKKSQTKEQECNSNATCKPFEAKERVAIWQN